MRDTEQVPACPAPPPDPQDLKPVDDWRLFPLAGHRAGQQHLLPRVPAIRRPRGTRQDAPSLSEPTARQSHHSVQQSDRSRRRWGPRAFAATPEEVRLVPARGRGLIAGWWSNDNASFFMYHVLRSSARCCSALKLYTKEQAADRTAFASVCSTSLPFCVFKLFAWQEDAGTKSERTGYYPRKHGGHKGRGWQRDQWGQPVH